MGAPEVGEELKPGPTRSTAARPASSAVLSANGHGQIDAARFRLRAGGAARGLPHDVAGAGARRGGARAGARRTDGSYAGDGGNEAAIVGAVAALSLTMWWRLGGALRARRFAAGIPSLRWMAQLFGNAHDLSRGRRLPGCPAVPRALNILPASDHAGTQLPQAAGVAWAAKMQKKPTVALASSRRSVSTPRTSTPGSASPAFSGCSGDLRLHQRREVEVVDDLRNDRGAGARLRHRWNTRRRRRLPGRRRQRARRGRARPALRRGAHDRSGAREDAARTQSPGLPVARREDPGRGGGRGDARRGRGRDPARPSPPSSRSTAAVAQAHRAGPGLIRRPRWKRARPNSGRRAPSPRARRPRRRLPAALRSGISVPLWRTRRFVSKRW